MARFEREAQVLASMNHPNIAAIYGVEERALIMELVEGETLHGTLPVETALNYAHQIAEALEYAHERGIVHRDLKPANIKVTPEGRVKVLDFGLAKAMSSDAARGNPESSPTLTMRATMAGVILGTAAYMSPEQARGQDADRRADIWAFGVVLYEMLTGKPLFAGATISDTLAAVLTKEPDWTRVPAQPRRLLQRCLEKDPKRRRPRPLRRQRADCYGLEWGCSRSSPPSRCGHSGGPNRNRSPWCDWTSIWAATCNSVRPAGSTPSSRPMACAWFTARSRGCSSGDSIRRRRRNWPDPKTRILLSSHRTGSGWHSSPPES
jgi:serine/threonine protein kinase